MPSQLVGDALLPEELDVANAINRQESAIGSAGSSFEAKFSGFQSEGVFGDRAKCYRWVVAVFYLYRELAVQKPQLPGSIEFGTVIVAYERGQILRCAGVNQCVFLGLVLKKSKDHLLVREGDGSLAELRAENGG